MRENKPSLGHPLGKSKGYGFLSFKNHDEALNCLRKVNNNPKAFGKNNVSQFLNIILMDRKNNSILYSTETNCVVQYRRSCCSQYQNEAIAEITTKKSAFQKEE